MWVVVSDGTVSGCDVSGGVAGGGIVGGCKASGDIVCGGMLVVAMRDSSGHVEMSDQLLTAAAGAEELCDGLCRGSNVGNTLLAL